MYFGCMMEVYRLCATFDVLKCTPVVARAKTRRMSHLQAGERTESRHCYVTTRFGSRNVLSSSAYIVIRRASLWCSAGVVAGVSKPFVLSSGGGSSDDSVGFLSSSPRSCGSGSTANLFGFLFITYLALIGQQGEYRAPCQVADSAKRSLDCVSRRREGSCDE